MKIAVVGAGIFGITTALTLSRAGHQVELFEQYGDILPAASSINQYRLHRGYHYPRSAATAQSSLHSAPLFEREYGAALLPDDVRHYYCVAQEKSLVSGADFKKFANEQGLEYSEEYPEGIRREMLDVSLLVPEKLIDPAALKQLCTQRLDEQKIPVHLNQKAEYASLQSFAKIILCGYAYNNEFLADLPQYQRDYQFEVCEKLVVELPPVFAKTSIVVMDGPFFCIDPYSTTPYHVMGHVEHAVHERSVGTVASVSASLRPLLNRGLIKNPTPTHFDRFIASAVKFAPAMQAAKHIGSLYTIRTVLPHVDQTDERPTLVEQLDDRLIRVFSGKIGNCVEAAERVRELV